MRKHLLLSVLLFSALNLQGFTEEKSKSTVKKFIYKKTPQAELAIFVHYPPN